MKFSNGITLVAFVSGYLVGLFFFLAMKDVPLSIVTNQLLLDPDAQTDNVAVFVMVFSRPTGGAKRNAIRETWIQLASGLNTSTKFVIGTQGLNFTMKNNLAEESRKYKDLVLFHDLQDSYHNLTLKLLKGVVWAHENVKFDFLIKSDDDLFIRLDQALAGVNSIKKQYQKRIYWGYFEGSATPMRTGKYQEHNWLKCPNYFPYALGGCYVLSRSVVSMVVRFSKKLYTGYVNEDTSMGSWLAPYNIIRVHDLRFTFDFQTAACNRNYIASHLHNITTLHEHYRRLVRYEALCDRDIESQARYIYNWRGISPMQCCNLYQTDLQLQPVKYMYTYSAFSRNNRFLNVF